MENLGQIAVARTCFHLRKWRTHVAMGCDVIASDSMGRICYGPRLLWAEFVMGRDVPEPKKGTISPTQRYCKECVRIKAVP